MTRAPGFGARPRQLTRRAALILPTAAALSGCSWFDDLFSDSKTPLPGKRIAVMTTQHHLTADAGFKPRIALPPPALNADWPMPGGTPAHSGGHPQLGDAIRRVWRAGIGEGGGYRRKISAQPVIAAGRVFTMDSDGLVRAYDVRNGADLWEFDTQAEDDRSGNLGGGLSIAGDTLFAATGRAELIALETATGKPRWRVPIGSPARAAGTIDDGRIFVPTLSDQIFAHAIDDGHRLWAFQALNATTAIFGLPSPAVADGFVVAGFGSGDVVALRAATGSVAWTESLSSGVRDSITEFATVRAMPAIVDGRVHLTSVGDLTVAVDLRSGRRLWERDFGCYESPWIAGDWMFVVTTEQQAAAIAREDGRIAWATQLPRWADADKQSDPIFWHGPTLAGDRLLFVGSNNGDQAMAVSPYTGKILGTQDLDDQGAVAPVVASATLFLITDDGTLVAFR